MIGADRLLMSLEKQATDWVTFINVAYGELNEAEWKVSFMGGHFPD